MEILLQRIAKKSDYEEWRDIKGYEGIYQVSNLGEVRSLDRITKTMRGHRTFTGKKLYPNIGTNGYWYVCLSKNGKITTKHIHNLVADAFLGVHYGLDVDHINENKLDNRLANLQFLSHHENASKSCRGRTKDNNMEKNPRAKIVFGEINGRIVEMYDCAKKLCIELGMNYSTFKNRMRNGGITINKIHYRYGPVG